MEIPIQFNEPLFAGAESNPIPSDISITEKTKPMNRLPILEPLLNDDGAARGGGVAGRSPNAHAQFVWHMVHDVHNQH